MTFMDLDPVEGVALQAIQTKRRHEPGRAANGLPAQRVPELARKHNPSGMQGG